jgi:hypothetical protein
MADLVPDVMRHRLVLSYEALAEGRTADDIVREVMAAVPMPDKPMQHAQGDEPPPSTDAAADAGGGSA